MTSELEIVTEGDVITSLTSPTFSTQAPRFEFNSIATNGTIWVAGSIDTLRKKTIYTYPEVMDFLNAYYDYTTAIVSVGGSMSQLENSNYLNSSTLYDEPIEVLKGVVLSSTISRKAMLSQAAATFKYLKENAPSVILRSVFQGIENVQTVKVFPSAQQINTLHTLAISTDGYSWKLLETNPFQPEVRAPSNFTVNSTKAAVVNGIAWNSTLGLWVAVGGRGNQRWNRTDYGGLHTTTSSLTSGRINTLYNNYQYKAFDGTPTTTPGIGDVTIIATSPDAETWTQYSIYQTTTNPPLARGIACSATTTVVVGTLFNDSGFGTVLTSSNCKQWTPIEVKNSVSVGLTEGYGVAYNGALWVVVGKGTTNNLSSTSLYTSSDGITWDNQILSGFVGSYLRSVAWNGSSWMAVGNCKTVYTSEDGYSWQMLDKPDFNQSANTAQIHDFRGVAWDGNYWIITGLNSIYRSQDGITWELINQLGGRCVATTVPLPILGGTIQTTNSIIVGQGSPASVLRSNNDSKWYPQIFDVTQTNYTGNRQKTYSDVVWTGNYWIIVGDPGNDNYTNNIARSTDGIEWTFPSNALVKCNAVAWNGSTLAVIGTAAIGSTILNAVSTDEGATWTSGNLDTCLGVASCIAWNGTLWAAGGYPGIATSADGLTWTLANTCPLTTVNSIAWNGYVWIAVGVGKSHSIALSINGRYWYSANPSTNLFTQGNGVAWNRTQWIAVGTGSSDTIARSVDGYTWTGLGKDVFTVAGNSIAWSGTNWLATGQGLYPFATSVTGNDTWERYELPITTLNRYANKTITLPYTGVENASILASISAGSAIVTQSTNSTIAAEEAAIKLAADAIASAAAAAAEAATRLSSKNAAADYRMKFLYWRKKIYDQVLQLNDTTYGVNIQESYPVEYILANSIYQRLVVYVTEGQYYYEKVADPASPLSIVSANLQQLESFNTSLTADLLQFYNNSRFLFKKKVDALYDKFVTNANTASLINGWGYSLSDTNNVIGDFNSGQTTLDSTRSTANSVFDTAITSITYTNGLASSYLYDKELTDTVTINGTTSTILSNITTTVADLYSTYTSVDFGILPFMYAVFNDNATYKTQADQYVLDTLDAAAKWQIVTGSNISRESEINSAFGTLYTKYYSKATVPYYYEAYSGIGGMVNTIPRSIKYFKIIAEDYSHPSQYATELGILYDTLKTKLDSLETTRITAINYARTLRNTTVKTKLNEFLDTTKTKYIEQLRIDTHIQTLCDLTYYSSSSYVQSKNFAVLVNVANKVYPQLYPFIRAVKFADAEAEDDGCIAPSTGWGSKLNDLPSASRGKQGLSGWGKFNETYYARQRLADHIRAHNANGYVNYIIDSQLIGSTVLWKDFLNFTETFTFTMLKDSIDTLTNTVNTLSANNSFLEQTIDDLVTQDLNDIQDIIVPAVDAYLSGLLTSTTEKLPLEADGIAFGDVSINGSTSLSGMIAAINTSYDNLTAAATVSLLGKTNAELKAIVENAIIYKTIISDIQTSDEYLTILEGIDSYKTSLQRATFHIEHMEEQIARWTRMKANALQKTPFPSTGISNGNGNPFIAGISPADSTYWTVRTYTTFYNPLTQQSQECTFNQATQKIEALPAFDLATIVDYAPTSTYKISDMVKYNGKLYECIRDPSLDEIQTILDQTNTTTTVTTSTSQVINTSPFYIQGVVPTDTARWKRRVYPYVEFNQVKIEASPENTPALNINEYTPYTPTFEYTEGDIVRSGTKIFICINDISKTQNVKGIVPTNANYWTEVTYPIVVYNGQEIQASPTNLPALSLSNFDEYSSTKTYYKGNFVKENSIIYELVEYTTTESLGKQVVSSLGSAPSVNANSRWVSRTYPVVYVSGSKIEATPGTFAALSISSYTAYSNSNYYSAGSYVAYNSKIYVCSLQKRNSLLDVPLTNTEYWMKIVFPTVIYNNQYTELIPGAIPPLTTSSFDSYQTTKRYYAGDIVNYNGSVYECTSGTPYGKTIKNIPPTQTSYWKERTYPYVVVDGVDVDANPDSGVFVELNHLDFHRYSNGFPYYIGDKVAYNGYVYECTNVTPPLLDAATILNIVPTNSSYWTKLTSTVETTYSIEHWYPNKSYDVGKLISYNGKIYKCETQTLNNTPSELGIYWSEITDYASVDVPSLYASGTSYGIGALISYRELATDLPNNETHKLNFYFCSSTELNRPVRYTYDKLYTIDEVDIFGDYKYQIQSGNWLTDTPRYGLSEDDPLIVPMFSAIVRRRVAMEIEIPYESLKYNVFSFDGRMKFYFKNLLTEVVVKPSTALSTYTALETRGTVVCTAFTTLESPPNINIYQLVSKAYQQIADYLTQTKTKVVQYVAQVNLIKTQYFNNPGVQNRIFENPYKFMNPTAFAGTATKPPQKQFLDLGVGNISEMEAEVYSGNQMNYTMEDIKNYYAKTNTINILQEEVGKLIFQAKCFTGFNVLFAMTQSKSKHGARFPMLIDGWDATESALNMVSAGGYGPYVNFDLPITNYDLGTKWAESRDITGGVSAPVEGTLLDQLNAITIASLIPPAYCIGPSPLLEALTYESNNPDLNRFAAVTKGAVGLVAAGFRNFVDPWQIVGAFNFVGQVVTNDYSKNYLTFVPEGKWTVFNERSKDVRAFKQLVNIERRAIHDAKDEYDKTALAGFLETVGKLIRLNQYDLDELNKLDIPDDTVVIRRTVTTTVPIPQPPTPPADYVAPIDPDPPQLKIKTSIANLAAEREQLRAMQRNLENRLSKLSGELPLSSKYYVRIPEAEYEKVRAVTSEGGKKTWVIKLDDAAASGLRGTSRVYDPKANTWNGTPQPTAAAQRSPSGIPVNQAAIDEAIQLRKVRRAEYIEAVVDASLQRTKRQILYAQIEDARLREVQMTTAIDEIEFKNAIVEAENDAVTADYRKQMTDHQEYMETLREKRALAEERYQKALGEYNKKVARSPASGAELSLDLQHKKVILSDVASDIVNGEEVLVIRRTAYETRLLTEPPMKYMLLRMLPASLIVQYEDIVNPGIALVDQTAKRLRLIITQAVAPAASATRNAMIFLKNRPSVKTFTQFLSGTRALVSKNPLIMAAAGATLEIVGVGLQAWQDGAFTDAERLE